MLLFIQTITMEFQISFILTTLLLPLSFVILVTKLCPKSRLPRQYQKLPPSPPKLPIIGHLHLLAAGLPHQVFARIAGEYGPIFLLQMGEVPAVVISLREGARALLKVQDPACANRPETISTKILCYYNTDIVFSPYNEYWMQMRKICILEMSAKNVKSFGSIRQAESLRLVESIRSSCGAIVNLTEKLFALSSSIICRAAFGKVRRDNEKLVELMKRAFEMFGGFELTDLFPSNKALNALLWNKHKLLRMKGRLDAILDGIVDEHRSKQRGEFDSEDIVDVLLRLKNNGELKIPITDDNIKAIIFDLFSGGTESSSTTIGWAMAELMRNPQVMARVQSEVREALKGKTMVEDNDIQGLTYLKLVIQETLRLHPPFPLVPRECRYECTVDGYSIPLKSKVFINIWSMGRNPGYWHEPETFEPERFINNSINFLGNSFEYIPFGSGRRMCPGMQFGLANVELPLALLLYHFDWKMPHGMTVEDIDMAEAGGLSVSRKNDLCLLPNIPISNQN